MHARIAVEATTAANRGSDCQTRRRSACEHALSLGEGLQTNERWYANTPDCHAWLGCAFAAAGQPAHPGSICRRVSERCCRWLLVTAAMASTVTCQGAHRRHAQRASPSRRAFHRPREACHALAGSPKATSTADDGCLDAAPAYPNNNAPWTTMLQ
eukprot:350440-Chlamydomonas_euryale.AAC.7